MMQLFSILDFVPAAPASSCCVLSIGGDVAVRDDMLKNVAVSPVPSCCSEGIIPRKEERLRL